jgi:hypothetical protein
MVEIAQIEMRVSDCREADAPATYAQRGLWWAMEMMSEDDAFYNEGWVVPVPGGTGIDQAVNVLQRVVERFDIFRTTFHRQDGGLRQIVASNGSLAVAVHDCGGVSVEDKAEGALRALVSTGFRADIEWPIRLAIVVKNERAQALVLGFNHLAIDLRGWRVVERTIAQLLADPSTTIPDEPGWQPVDIAAHESSSAGRAANRAALDRWRQILSSAPPSMFDFETVPEEQDRYWQLRMTSSALAIALAVVADRSRVSNSAVLIAAISAVFGQYSGHTETVGQLNVANRIDQETHNVVGYLCWDSLFYAEWGGLSFDEISRRCFNGALDAYRHGEYERDQAVAIREGTEHQLGAKIDLGWQFNDCREAISSVAQLARSTSHDFEARRNDTRISIVDSWPHISTRFYVDVYDEPDSIAVELLCDTRYIPVPVMHRILRAIESLMIAAAEHDLAPEEIARSIDLPPARSGNGWVRHGKGWVHLPALRQAWLDLVGPSAAVFAQPLSDGTSRLVAYRAVEEVHESVPDTHAAFVRALGDRSDICAPDHYIWCSETPADMSASLEWDRSVIVDRGSGRDAKETSTADLEL